MVLKISALKTVGWRQSDQKHDSGEQFGRIFSVTIDAAMGSLNFCNLFVK